MRSDVDKILAERDLAAAVLVKTEHASPAFSYMTGRAGHISVGYLVCRRGKKPHLVHGSMERDAAAATGFETSDFGQRGYRKIAAEEKGIAPTEARFLDELLRDLGVTGRVVLEGIGPFGRYHHILRRLEERRPDLQLVEDKDPGVFVLARLTKDEDEVEQVRKVGRVCGDAYARVRGVMGGGRLDGGKLKDAAGWVTVGRLRQEIRRVFFEAGLEEPHANIVAQGRDAGVPHNGGNDADVVKEGAPIVIDLFPAQPGGGYFFDVTRTYCAGRAPEELRSVFECVRGALNDSLNTLQMGASARSYQERTCDFFEKHGHPTIRTNDRTEEGYVHGLGHGIGLEVHERPNLGGPPSNLDKLDPGTLFTIEPGLYYPSRGLGVRLEDVVYTRPDGTFENLAEHIPYELEVAPAS